MSHRGWSSPGLVRWRRAQDYRSGRAPGREHGVEGWDAALAGHRLEQFGGVVQPDGLPWEPGERVGPTGNELEGRAVVGGVDAERAHQAQLLVHEVVGV